MIIIWWQIIKLKTENWWKWLSKHKKRIEMIISQYKEMWNHCINRMQEKMCSVYETTIKISCSVNKSS